MTRTVALDLTEAESAVSAVITATEGLEVGLLFYGAGADPNYRPFLAQPLEEALAMVQRNCMAPLRLCHHFAAPMQQRGRGAIVLVSSGAGLVGGPFMVAYGAAKAFDMVMAEALWSELHPSGVDVLGLVLGKTDTPALRRLLLKLGHIEDFATPIPGLATPTQVVEDALEHLSTGPTYFAGADVAMAQEVFRGMSRNEAAQLLFDLGDALAIDSSSPT
jgi:uncharacterized protein